MYRYSLWTILFGALVGGIITGFIYWYVISRVILWIGKWFGGQGSWDEVRTASLYGGIPFIAKLVIQGLQVFLFGNIAFYESLPPLWR